MAQPVVKKAGGLRFSAKMDIILLNEVLTENPFKNGSWENVSAAVRDQGLEASARTCREHTNLILGHFKSNDRENLRK